jgi:hypothetical protein
LPKQRTSDRQLDRDRGLEELNRHIHGSEYRRHGRLRPCSRGSTVQTGCSTAARTFTIAATRAPGGAHTRSTTSSGHGCPLTASRRRARSPTHERHAEAVGSDVVEDTAATHGSIPAARRSKLAPRSGHGRRRAVLGARSAAARRARRGACKSSLFAKKSRFRVACAMGPSLEDDADSATIRPRGARGRALWGTRDAGNHPVLHGEEEA